MAEIKILDLADVPDEGKCKKIIFDHPVTCDTYELAAFQVKGKYHIIPDTCPMCGNSLSVGPLKGLYVFCIEEHGWSVKNGICKHDRTRVMPSYKVKVQEDGLYIEI